MLVWEWTWDGEEFACMYDTQFCTGCAIRYDIIRYDTTVTQWISNSLPHLSGIGWRAWEVSGLEPSNIVRLNGGRTLVLCYGRSKSNFVLRPRKSRQVRPRTVGLENLKFGTIVSLDDEISGLALTLVSALCLVSVAA